MNLFHSFRFPLFCSGLLALALGAGAATPVLLDFDMTGRPFEEGNEPGYTQWAIGETTSAASTTVNGITFTLNRNGGSGTAIKSYYWKAGIQTPYFARLIADALSVVGGDAGASVRLSISGLSAGTHTLQSFHNAIDGYAHGNIKISVDNTVKIASQPQSNRQTVQASAASSFITFTATAGKTVNIDYVSVGTGSYKNVFLNNLSLDIANPDAQAQTPTPTDRDMHVDADNGSLTLKWAAPKNGATAYEIYLGTDSASVAEADKNTSLYLGNQSALTKTVSIPNKLNTYYWRVDAIASGVTTSGNVWKFGPRHLAFPGAEGYGRFARGGRGGKVVHVTNLNDAGAGSLREAVENDIGPRTIVFDVGGIITLQSRLTLGSSYVTVAGQTAPGKGILIRTAPFGVSGATDVIIRHMRVRLGYGATFDGMGLQGSDHSIFDHNSISWTIDESFSSRSGKNITLQKTLISEALNAADHQNYPSGTQHGYAATIGGDVGSFHHNLLAHNEGRNWSMGCGLDGNGYFWGRLDIFNNVVYNWGGRTTDGGCHEVNFVGNYYKTGAATTKFVALTADFDNFPGTQQYYCKGNLVSGKLNDTSATNNGCVNNGNPDPWVTKPFFPSYATIHTAKEAYKHVLSDVGATQPVFDDHDIRMIKETRDSTWTYKGSVTGKAGLPDRESDVGGYESFPTTTRASGFDTDGDGMPDYWETAVGTNPKGATGDFSESNADPDGDGYTNLEDYLNWLAIPHAIVDKNRKATFNVKFLSRGFQKSPSYAAVANTCATSTIADSTLTVTSKGNCRVFTVDFTITDSEGAKMTRTVGLLDSTATVSTTNLPPYFTSADTFTVAENISDPIGTLTGIDPEGLDVTFKLTASSDSALFTLSPAGVLAFINPPDYENPLDNGANNIHHINAVISDGVHETVKKIIVIVTDVTDDGPVGIWEPGMGISGHKAKPAYDLIGRRNGTHLRLK